MGTKSSTGRKGAKKHGRSKDKCAKYSAEHRKETNKRREALKREKKYAKLRAKREQNAQ